jgi:hypothetical protein
VSAAPARAPAVFARARDAVRADDGRHAAGREQRGAHAQRGAAGSESPTGVVCGAVRSCDAGRGAAVPCFIPATIA